MSDPLPRPDALHAQAAIGWLELGNAAEAAAELEKVQPPLRSHPDVLEVQWQLQANGKQWATCLEIATALQRVDPDRPSGYLLTSVALHGMKRYQEAWDHLYPAAERFPHVHAIPYDLACYACHLGRLAEARELLKGVFEADDAARWRELALRDADLQPLWDEIPAL